MQDDAYGNGCTIWQKVMNLLITVHVFTSPDILISFAREVSRGQNHLAERRRAIRWRQTQPRKFL
jgi:hypothetical protein